MVKIEGQRIVISQSSTRKKGLWMEMVVYKTKGKSLTKHEVSDQSKRQKEAEAEKLIRVGKI